ncbi:hypothetical protein NEOLEDRAFT_1129587 [Neolentinus lepideus HHB14362 ss-1]|uniref:Uncharacterized protein n=1 Tax=Neolentinus lepideus HHB14362 ss-1 TaxID=1314782 RepID=A0A165UIX0_9AGAM|nr:hypothetical protein NEOLEDRAFT_1129587 [Neolentinus lepideus HHB14362 ss-1]
MRSITKSGGQKWPNLLNLPVFHSSLNSLQNWTVRCNGGVLKVCTSSLVNSAVAVEI